MSDPIFCDNNGKLVEFAACDWIITPHSYDDGCDVHGVFNNQDHAADADGIEIESTSDYAGTLYQVIPWAVLGLIRSICTEPKQ